MIRELAANGARIGVTANSHKPETKWTGLKLYSARFFRAALFLCPVEEAPPNIKSLGSPGEMAKLTTDAPASSAYG
jgi:hypothetical protein